MDHDLVVMGFHGVSECFQWNYLVTSGLIARQLDGADCSQHFTKQAPGVNSLWWWPQVLWGSLRPGCKWQFL